MKVVYIGASDGLAHALVDRLKQEGNDVFLLSDNPLTSKPKGSSSCRFYRIPYKGEEYEKLLLSIAPDCIVFAGNHYVESNRERPSDETVALLARTLRTATSFQTRFVLLSSTEVYGYTDGAVSETAPCAPTSQSGIRFLQEEQLVGIYQRRYGLDAVVLRASQLYTSRSQQSDADFLSEAFTQAAQIKGHLPNTVYQPLNVSDLTDAIKRVIERKGSAVYNVCGVAMLSAEQLHHLVCKHEGIKGNRVVWEYPPGITVADSTRLQEEVGWRQFWDLETQFSEGEIAYVPLPERQQEKKRIIPVGLRQLIENLVIFAAFFALDFFSGSHEVFSLVNWLMVYVILISVSYSPYQSALAAILASIAYPIIRSLSFEGISTFYFYADSVLAVMEFVFLGLIVSYTANSLREKLRNSQEDLKLLQEEYEDLKAINAENVLIKNEYEERLLTSKTGFPKLYEMISKLMVQEPERIVMETMEIVAELTHTNTVAVYQGRAENPWLRLVGALNNDAAMDGKTWNLSDYPSIYQAVMQGELYQGQFGTDEPAVVLPVVSRDESVVVILIKSLPYESETLYHINLLKTLSLLLRDAIERALEYEALARNELFVEGSDILRPDAFRKRIALAQEKAEKRLAEFCVVQLVSPEPLSQMAQTASALLRATDYLGIDENGNLCALLNNTSSQNLNQLQKRFLESGINLHLAMNESVMA